MHYKYLLIFRYGLINIVALALLIIAITQGFLSKAIEADVTNMVIVILCLFFFGFIIATWRTLYISKEINLAYETNPSVKSLASDFKLSLKNKDSSSRNNLTYALRLKLSSKISHIKFIASTLVVLGLIGTVIGFIIALSGIDSGVASNPEEISRMVSTLIDGMSVALYTTLVGAITSVWLSVCYQILSTGTTKLLSKIIEKSEAK